MFVLENPETNGQTVDWPMCVFFVLLLKMDNMLVVCELC